MWPAPATTSAPSRGQEEARWPNSYVINVPSHHGQALLWINMRQHTFYWQNASLSFLLVMPYNFPLGQYYRGGQR